MADFPTRDDLFKIARDEILRLNGNVKADVIDREGSDSNILVAAMAAIGDEVIGQLIRVCSGFTLGTAKGTALRKLIYDRYGLLPVVAAPARGSVWFSTTAPAPTTFTIPKGTRLSTADGVVFYTVADASFLVGTTGPVVVEVRSLLAGTAQAADTNTITNIISVITNAPSDLAVINNVATSGQADDEAEEAYRDRARAYFSTVRRGTVSAIELGALAYPGVVHVKGFEDLDAWGRPAKRMQLIITDQYTDRLADLAVTPPTYATQSQVLSEAVRASLYDVRADGIYIEVFVAQVILQSVVLALAFEAGANVDSVAYNARAAIVNCINALRPGDALSTENMVESLRSVRGLIVSGDEILSPAGEVIPTRLEVLRTTLGLVRASTTQADVALMGTANPDAI